jgi:hypothetical protein
MGALAAYLVELLPFVAAVDVTLTGLAAELGIPRELLDVVVWADW